MQGPDILIRHYHDCLQHAVRHIWRHSPRDLDSLAATGLLRTADGRLTVTIDGNKKVASRLASYLVDRKDVGVFASLDRSLVFEFLVQWCKVPRDPRVAGAVNFLLESAITARNRLIEEFRPLFKSLVRAKLRRGDGEAMDMESVLVLKAFRLIDTTDLTRTVIALRFKQVLPSVPLRQDYDRISKGLNRVFDYDLDTIEAPSSFETAFDPRPATVVCQ